MGLRIRFQYPTGSRLGYSIERLSDGSLFDFSTSTFVATAPATPISSLPEDSGNFLGRYKLTLTPTPAAQFTDGDYVVTVHDQANANAVVAELGSTIHAGDDASVIPQPGSSVVDPWSVSLPGAYALGSAGSILGTNLDAHVSSRSTFAGGAVASVTAPVTVGANNDKSGYALAATGLNAITLAGGITATQALQNLDAAVSSRSTYAGGAVASVTAPVTVGTNNDKSGYALSSTGLNAITLTGGINATQALSNLDAAVSSRSTYAGGPVASVTAPVTVGTNNDKSGYALSSTGLNSIQVSAGITATQALQNLDAAVSSRSTYAGGPVASVTAPVTVGMNNDKSGYALSSAGLDAIQVEAGINARQALSPILAACAGVVAGAGTGVVVIKGGNSSTTRITATTDNAGNRSTVTLTLPT